MAEAKTMEKLTEAMMEHCCDKLCKYPHEVEDQDELDDICCECEMGQFAVDILNMHNAKGTKESEHELSEEVKRGPDD